MALQSSLRARQMPQLLFRATSARRARCRPPQQQQYQAAGFADVAAASAPAAGDADAKEDAAAPVDSSATDAADDTEAKEETPLFSSGGLHVMPGTVLLPRVPHPLNPPRDQLEAWDWNHVRPYVQAAEDPHPIPRLHREYEDWDTQADPDHYDWADKRMDLPLGAAMLPLGPELSGSDVTVSTKDIFEVGIVPRARWEMEKGVTLSVTLGKLGLSAKEHSVLSELVAVSEDSNQVFTLDDGDDVEAQSAAASSRSSASSSSIGSKQAASAAAAGRVLRVRVNQFPRRHDNERFAIASTQAAIRHAKRLVALDDAVVEQGGTPELWGVTSSSDVKFDDVAAYDMSDVGQSQVTLDGDFNEFAFAAGGATSVSTTA